MKQRNRFFRALVPAFVCCSMLMVFSASAFAADAYPSKPVRFIVPGAAAGPQDIISRLVAPGLSERLGRQVVVENHAGGGGVTGLEMVARSAPDGYTLANISESLLFKPALGEKLPFDPVKSFAPIGLMGRGYNVLAVHPSVPAKNVQEFVALLKQKPGELICIGAGRGGVSHMVAEMFKMKTGTDFKIVQFQGSGPGTTDLLGGHSQFGFISLMNAMPHAQSGKLRILAVMGSARSPLAPEVPMISENNGPGVAVNNWWGLVAPAGTPQPVLDRLSRELREVLTAEETKKLYLKTGAEAVYGSAQELGDTIVREIAAWTEVVKAAGITID
ncbi:MAG: tripartite tricarboxylate transporter substrate binding protein [Syntrophaceae bacterium]|nr:tripartite tricarboxylate transporter substrate binding protein [Syntrophaceae bacterium]